MRVFTKSGLQIAHDFERIVHGGRGDYIEISLDDIIVLSIIVPENQVWRLDNEKVYILFEYCDKHIKPSYNNYKNFCGELCQCAAEIERRTGAEESSIVDFDADVSDVSLIVCDKKIKFMAKANIQVNGDLNYILYGYCLRHKTAKEYSLYWNLARYKRFARELRLAAKKITKEILAPYEDTKIAENGDVV